MTYNTSISYCKKAMHLLSASIVLICGGCSSSAPRTYAIYCQERQIEICVDGNHLGRDQVYYTLPKGQRYMEVTGIENGVDVYKRTIDTENYSGNLIEIQIPKNYKYSSKPY